MSEFEKTPPLEEPNLCNPGYTLVFATGSGSIMIFRMKEALRLRRVLEAALLIIPPNDLTPLKDRLGIFNPNAYPELPEDKILELVKDLWRPMVV